MKNLRDILIVIVLGGVVIYFVTDWIQDMHQHYVSHSVVVGKASLACAEDGMAGCDFSSEESAQAYLKSKGHLDAVESRNAKKRTEDDKKARVNALISTGVSGVRAACIKEGIVTCNRVTKENIADWAALIVGDQITRESIAAAPK